MSFRCSNFPKKNENTEIEILYDLMRCVYFLVCVVYDLPLAQLYMYTADHGNPTKLKGLNSKSKLHGVAADENWPTSRSFYTRCGSFLAEKMQAWMDGGVNHSHIHEKSRVEYLLIILVFQLFL